MISLLKKRCQQTDKSKEDVIIPKKYKVFLDDIRFPPDNTWTEFKDPYDCFDFYKNNWADIVEISLDHDLWYINQFGEEVTWYDVLEWILNYRYGNNSNSNNRNIPLPSISFHTANPVGRQNMERILKYFISLDK